MAKARQTFRKKEIEDKKKKKQKDKADRKEARKANAKSGSLDDMMAYVDEYGRISTTPPEPSEKKEISPESIELGVPRQTAEEPAAMLQKGIVTFFNVSKGYGFIRNQATGQSVFVHINAINGSIAQNDHVTFTLEKSVRGLTAVNVTKANKP